MNKLNAFIFTFLSLVLVFVFYISTNWVFIEQSDDELPEQVLGCSRLCYLNMANSPEFPSSSGADAAQPMSVGAAGAFDDSVQNPSAVVSAGGEFQSAVSAPESLVSSPQLSQSCDSNLIAINYPDSHEFRASGVGGVAHDHLKSNEKAPLVAPNAGVKATFDAPKRGKRERILATLGLRKNRLPDA